MAGKFAVNQEKYGKRNIDIVIGLLIEFISISKKAKEYCTPGHRAGNGFRKIKEDFNIKFSETKEEHYETVEK